MSWSAESPCRCIMVLFLLSFSELLQSSQAYWRSPEPLHRRAALQDRIPGWDLWDGTAAWIADAGASTGNQNLQTRGTGPQWELSWKMSNTQWRYNLFDSVYYSLMTLGHEETVAMVTVQVNRKFILVNKNDWWLEPSLPSLWDE